MYREQYEQITLAKIKIRKPELSYEVWGYEVQTRCDIIDNNIDKEGNPIICNNKDRIWGHYVKWNVKTKIGKYYMISHL